MTKPESKTAAALFKARLEDHVDAYSTQIEDQFISATNKCGSEIEKMMLAELIFCNFEYLSSPAEIVSAPGGMFPPHLKTVLQEFRPVIVPQFRVGKYRVDFLVLLPGRYLDTTAFVIECDGHDFHEKTKAQAAKDKGRDRFLQAQGYHVFRFTGSEVYQDAKKCVDEICAFGSRWVFDQINPRDN